MDNDKIIIYQTEDGQTKIDVRLENDTVWLTQAQMAELFEKDQSVVARHINNAIKDGELDESNMHFLHNTHYKYRPTKIYDLDVIISVGYRVHSKRGTAFRIWARKIIKDYLVKGYAVNERIRKEQIGELRQLVGMLGRTIQNQPLLSNDETNALFEVVTDYTYALDTLDNYDYERLSIDKTTKMNPSTLPTRMRWKPSAVYAKSLVVLPCLAMRKTIPSKAASDRFIRPLEAKSSIQV